MIRVSEKLLYLVSMDASTIFTTLRELCVVFSSQISLSMYSTLAKTPFQQWQSHCRQNRYGPQELQLDSQITQGVRELVLHVHCCPKLPQAAKPLGQVPNIF